MNPLMPQSNAFVIEWLRYFPVGQHNPMFMRPYTFQVQQDAVAMLANRMDETKSGKVTPGILNGITNGIMQPSAVGYDTVIDNSWVSNRRYIFMMKVKNVDYTGLETNTYVIGYTDHDGVTTNGHVNPQMVHFINSVLTTNVHLFQTPFGVERVEKLADTYQAMYSQGGQDLYTQRPVDLYNAISVQDMAGWIDIPSTQAYATTGMINQFNNNVVSSTTENNISTEYLSKILTSGIHATKAREIHMNSYSMGSDDPSEKFFTEPSISNSPFIMHLSRTAGYRSSRPVFEFNTLMNMDPTIYDRFEMFNTTRDVRDPILMNTPDVGDFWHGQDPQTVRAYSIIENAISVATKHGFTKINFQATNMDNPLGQANIYILSKWSSFLSLQERDMHYLLEMFKEKFIIEVFLSETSSGRMPINLTCYIDLHGTSKIYLEWPGMPGNWYTLPTFAGSNFAPVLTVDQSAVDMAGQQLNMVLETLVQAQAPQIY